MKDNERLNIAVVLAGGVGKRMGTAKPKQFLSLGGRLVVEHSIDTFEEALGIDEVAVVVHQDWTDFVRGLVERRGWTKVRRVVEGGEERYLSSLNAVRAYADAPREANLILHDAARPWLSQAVVERVVKALEHAEAVGVAVPSVDTVWQVDTDKGRVVSLPRRSEMYRAQTPQAFRLRVIEEAYRRALEDPALEATDDCGVVMRYCPEVPIVVVEGEEQNRKITFMEDVKEWI